MSSFLASFSSTTSEGQGSLHSKALVRILCTQDVHTTSPLAHPSADTVPFPWSLAAPEPSNFDPQPQAYPEPCVSHAASRSAAGQAEAAGRGWGWGNSIPGKGGLRKSGGLGKGRGREKTQGGGECGSQTGLIKSKTACLPFPP